MCFPEPQARNWPTERGYPPNGQSILKPAEGHDLAFTTVRKGLRAMVKTRAFDAHNASAHARRQSFGVAEPGQQQQRGGLHPVAVGGFCRLGFESNPAVAA